MKIKVLCFVGYYLPGYKAGGPLRTIANMVAQLEDNIEFWIVTRDRDLGDSAAYVGVKANEWHEKEGAYVYYLTPRDRNVRSIAEIISETDHDILYLNSFYDPVVTIMPLLARRFFKASVRPCIIAPRGEFSAGAFALKTLKKRIYNAIGKFVGLFDDVTFQASSEFEASDIKAVLGVKRCRIEIATDLPGADLVLDNDSIQDRSNFGGNVLKVVFLSRISPMKNLDFALSALAITKGEIQFDIYGPTEDVVYWERCKSLFDSLPSNVSVSYCGSVMPSETHKIFSQYDLFFFPTRGENYGHVIAESLSVGTPVLVSDQTPWRDLENLGLGWDVPLISLNQFSDKIDEFAALSLNERLLQRKVVRTQAGKLLRCPEIIEANRELFRARLIS